MERERFRIGERSEEESHTFYASPEFERLFKELIADRYYACRIMAKLREKECSRQEMAEDLGLSQASVAGLVDRMTMQGMVQYKDGSALLQSGMLPSDPDQPNLTQAGQAAWDAAQQGLMPGLTRRITPICHLIRPKGYWKKSRSETRAVYLADR